MELRNLTGKRSGNTINTVDRKYGTNEEFMVEVRNLTGKRSGNTYK
jgi:hypothetical protein